MAAYAAPLGDWSPFSDPSLKELSVARPGWETMGLPEQDDTPPCSLKQRRGREGEGPALRPAASSSELEGGFGTLKLRGQAEEPPELG